MMAHAAGIDNDRPREPRPSRAAPTIAPTDGERLMRFRLHRDEAAFREVVTAHAALVWGVCWQVLRHRQDAEDAFQATFFILARKAGSIRAPDSAAGWLYRVAFRTAVVARTRRRRRAEEPLADEPQSADDQLVAVAHREQCLLLLEELRALPARYQQPVAMCYLEGKSRGQVAEELGVTLASVKGSLARGTRILRSRLARRGVALSGAMAVAAAQASSAHATINASLVAHTAAASLGFATGSTSAIRSGLLSSGAAVTLAEKGLSAMTITAIAKPAAGLMALCAAAALALGSPDATLTGGGATTAALSLAGAQDVIAEDQGGIPAIDVEADDNGGPWNDAPGITTPAEIVLAQNPAQQPTQPASALAPPQGSIPGPAPTADVLVRAPVPAVAAAPVVQPIPQNWPQPSAATLPQAPQLPWNVSIMAPEAASRDAMKLEMEYWSLKARGLRTKADALQLKAQTIRPDVGSQAESMEARAEADLTLAEVKLCEANEQRLKEALERLASTSSQSQPYNPYRDPRQNWSYPQAPTLPGPTPSNPAPNAPQPAQPWTPQNSWVNPVNPPQGPGIAAYPVPSTAPPAAGSAPQVEAMAKQLEELRADNERLRARIEDLEDSARDARE